VQCSEESTWRQAVEEKEGKAHHIKQRGHQQSRITRETSISISNKPQHVREYYLFLLRL